jgi:hypothetical protein
MKCAGKNLNKLRVEYQHHLFWLSWNCKNKEWSGKRITVCVSFSKGDSGEARPATTRLLAEALKHGALKTSWGLFNYKFENS